MKFYISVVHPLLGDTNSEIYNTTEDEYKKIVNEVLNNKLNKLDFYQDDGSFVYISEEVLKNSLIFVKVKKS